MRRFDRAPLIQQLLPGAGLTQHLKQTTEPVAQESVRKESTDPKRVTIDQSDLVTVIKNGGKIKGYPLKEVKSPKYTVYIMPTIRSDRLQIQADSPAQREALGETLALYRRLVRDLMTVVFTHWPLVGPIEGKVVVPVIEQLIHPTSKRPDVRYRYFARGYHKFPSYLRRVANNDAVGQVRSFMSRYGDWLDGQRHHLNARPPKLTASTNTFSQSVRRPVHQAE